MRIERIEWVDSSNYVGWLTEEDFEESAHQIVSVGILVKENDEAIVLALSFDESEGAKPWAQVTMIPKSAVKSRRKMRLNGA